MSASSWVRRVYAAPDYQDTRWHRIASASDSAVRVACGRIMDRVTAAKVENHLEWQVYEPADTCAFCAGRGGRRFR